MKNVHLFLMLFLAYVLSSCKKETANYVVNVDCLPTGLTYQAELLSLNDSSTLSLELEDSSTITINDVVEGNYQLRITGREDSLDQLSAFYSQSFSASDRTLKTQIALPSQSGVVGVIQYLDDKVRLRIDDSRCNYKPSGTYYYMSQSEVQLYMPENEVRPIEDFSSELQFEMKDSVVYLGIETRFYDNSEEGFVRSKPFKLVNGIITEVEPSNNPPKMKLNEVYEFNLEIDQELIYFTDTIPEGMYMFETFDSNTDTMSGAGLNTRIFGTTEINKTTQELGSPNLVIGRDNYFQLVSHLKDNGAQAGNFGVMLHDFQTNTFNPLFPLLKTDIDAKSVHKAEVSLSPGYHTIRSYQPNSDDTRVFYYMKEKSNDFWFSNVNGNRLESISLGNPFGSDTLEQYIDVNQPKTFEVYFVGGYYGTNASIFFDIVKE